MQLYKDLHEVLRKNQIQLIESGDYIEFEASSFGSEVLRKHSLAHELIQNNKCRLLLYQNDFDIFFSRSDFFQRIQKRFDRNILFIDDKTLVPYFWSASDQKTYVDFVETQTNHFFNNVIAYFELLDFLKNQEHKEDNVFYFVDHFSWDNRLIVFTTLKRVGKMTISVPANVPVFNEDLSLKTKIEKFYRAFDENNKHLPKFIKNELFKFLSKEKKEDRFVKLLERLDEILVRAEQNFEVYLNDLSLENLKKDYIEHKDKYFQQLRDVLGKISGQIIALPLTITASAFASYKSFDNTFLLSIIILAFIAFTIYSLFNLRLQLEDIKDIGNSSRLDYNKLKSSPFFIKYPEELNSFEQINSKIRKRISLLSGTIYTYYFTLSFTNLLFVSYCAFQLGMPLHFLLFAAVVIILILVFLFSFLFYYGSFTIKGVDD